LVLSSILSFSYSKSNLLMTCRSSPNSLPRRAEDLCLAPSHSPPLTATVQVGMNFMYSIIFLVLVTYLESENTLYQDGLSTVN
jgi:hypothetical protein